MNTIAPVTTPTPSSCRTPELDGLLSPNNVKAVIQRFSQPYRVAAWDDFPAGARDASDRWLSTRLNSVFPAFNTTKVKPGEIKTWKDLCNKRYEGRVAFEMSDVDIYTGLKEIFGEVEAQAIVRCVAANRAVGRSGHAEMANLLAAGEFWATFSSLGPRIPERSFASVL